MNQINSTIEAGFPSTHQASKRIRPSTKSGTGLALHIYRGGKLLKTGKCGKMDPRLVCLLKPTSLQAESYFRLRHTLEEMHNPERGIVVAVTSPVESDGKTLTAINLAGALALDERARVLLVDLNLRQFGANVRKYLDLKKDADAGVSDWLEHEASDSGLASYHLEGFNLHVIPSGARVDSPYELLKSTRLDELFRQARLRYDYIIVDTPQALHLPDIDLITRVVDGFVVVIKADSTPQDKLEETLNMMTREKVLGLVFNGNRTPR